MLFVTELFNIAVNGFDVEKSARCSRTRCKRDPVYSLPKDVFKIN